MFPNLPLHQFSECPQDIAELKFQLMEAARNIEDKFGSLICTLIKSFEERKLPVKELAREFVHMSESHSVFGDDNTISKLKNACSIDDIMYEVRKQKYVTVFNYHLLKSVIKDIGTKPEKEAFERYFKSFQKYCERSVFEVPQTMFDKFPKGIEFGLKVNDIHKYYPGALSTETDENGGEVVTQSSKILGLSVNETMFVVAQLAKIVKKDRKTFCIANATQGCTKIVISVSRSIAEDILTEINTNPGMAELKSSGIHVVCGPPGKPQAVEITAASIKLAWTKPDFDIRSINEYVISFRPAIGKVKVWETLKTTQQEEFTVTITDIVTTQRDPSFIFKVCAVGDFGEGVESEESEKIKLLSGMNKIPYSYS